MKIKVYCWYWLDVVVRVGPWQARFTDPRMMGTFRNGSSWFSGFARWRDEPEF